MGKIEDFKSHLQQGYNFKDQSLILGTGIMDLEPVKEVQIKIPLKTMNRHGLIAGAT